MKTKLLLFAIILFSASSFAQQSERLIASCSSYYSSGAYANFDSFTYIYSGTRCLDTGWYYVEKQAFDTMYTWHYNSGYIPYQMDIRTHDLDNKLIQNKRYRWQNGFYYIGYYTFNYTTVGFPSTVIVTPASNTQDEDKEAYQYDNNNNKTAYVRQTYDYALNVWDTAEAKYWTYNSSQKVSSYSDRQYYVSGVYFGTGQTLYRYNTSGNIDSIISGGFGQSNVFTANSVSIDSYSIDGYLSLKTDQSEDSSGWNYRRRTAYIYDSQHNVTENIIQDWDTSSRNWVNNFKYVMTYDNYNMQTSLSTYYWSNSSSDWGSGYTNQYRYYYERYSTTGLVETSNYGGANIYPVPATEMLSVDIKWEEPQPSSATIYDAEGRACGQIPIPAESTYHGYIPLNGMAPGNYSLIIKGTQGSISKSFNIVR